MHVKKSIALLLCIFMLCAFTGCDSRDYKSALALAESGDWEGAKALFVSLGDYKDAVSYISECDYHIAKNAMESEDYSSATAIFASLKSYRDASDMLTECHYLSACASFENEDYSAAAEAFAALGDYKDAADRLLSCKYEMAVALYAEEKYNEALSSFREFEDYEDADRYITICSLLVNQQSFVDAFVAEMEAAFANEEIPYRLEESADSHRFDQRSFKISTEGGSGTVFVIFSHMDTAGASHQRGQINGITILGNASSADKILLVYPEFIATAGTMLHVLDDASDTESLALMLNEEMQKLVENGPTDGNTARYAFEHEGYTCSAATLFLSDYYRFVLTVTIPELMEQ